MNETTGCLVVRARLETGLAAISLTVLNVMMTRLFCRPAVLAWLCLLVCWSHHRNELLADEAAPDVDEIVTLLELVLDVDEATAQKCLRILTTSVQSGTVNTQRVEKLKTQLGERLGEVLTDPDHPLRLDAAVLLCSWKDERGVPLVRQVLADRTQPGSQRLQALQTLVALGDAGVLPVVAAELSRESNLSISQKGEFLAALGRLEQPAVAEMLLGRYSSLEPELQPRGLELLSQRPQWARPLLAAISEKQIPADALNLNQLRRIAAFRDDALQTQFRQLYGAIREGRNPNREQVYWRMRDFLSGTPGDPHAGGAVFKKVCAQCHKIYGEGAEVGPDITRNGRNNWEQLLQNVFDPSAVIGPGYQAWQVATADGRVLTGLPVEDSPQRIVLKLQGGKLETIPRDQIDEHKVSELSMMPEELEKQLTPQELADLFAYLALDRPPGDPEARLLNGAPEPVRR